MRNEGKQRWGAGLLLLLAPCAVGTAQASTPADGELSSPAPRWGHLLIWDPVRSELLLFGGAPRRGEYLADTWTWNVDGWRRHDIEGPPARGFAAAAFHRERQTIVMHGGRAHDRQPHADTWEWDGAEWAPLDENPAFAVDHHALVYLEDSKQLLAFGGWNGSGVSNETWRFDNGWQRLDIEGPPGRAAFGMTLDAARGVPILFGGLWIDGQYADIWEWKQDAWSAVSGPYDNSSLDHHALLWDPERNQLVGFGGKDCRNQVSSRTFTITNGRVRELAAHGPEARHSSPLAWDDDARRVLLFGGKRYDGDEQVALGDLWAWNGTTWKRISE